MKRRKGCGYQMQNQKWLANCRFWGHFEEVNIIYDLVVCAIKINTVIHIQKAQVKKLLQGSEAVGAEGAEKRGVVSLCSLK